MGREPLPAAKEAPNVAASPLPEASSLPKPSSPALLVSSELCWGRAAADPRLASPSSTGETSPASVINESLPPGSRVKHQQRKLARLSGGCARIQALKAAGSQLR